MDAAGPHRRRASARAAGEWHWAWDVYVVGVCVAATAAILLPSNRFPGNTAVVVTAVAAIVVCVLTVGRPLLRSDKSTWQAWLFVGLVVALCVVAVWSSPVAVAAVPVAVAVMPAVYPIFWVLLPLRAALIVTTAVVVTPLIIALIVGGPESADIPLMFLITLLSVVATAVIGTIIATVTWQRAELSRVVGELAASRAESARLSHAAGASAERERLAREIHDTLAQGFTSIVALAQAVEAELEAEPAAAGRHVELIRATARENLAEARVMLAGLTPVALDDGSLAAAISRQCDKFTAETGIAVTMSVDRKLPALRMAADVVLLRAAQEAFANIRKHAQASTVCLELTAADGRVRLSLQDNGVGLTSDHAEGFGLRGMRARVAQVGGTMTVSRTSGGGLTIKVEVPT